MSFVSIGDLAQSLQLRRASGELQKRQDILTRELSTGRVSDRAAAVQGDQRAVSAIERSITILRSQATAAAEASLFAATMQTALGTAQDAADTLAPDLLSASSMKAPPQVDALAAAGRGRFDAVVAALNAQAAGRYVLSGTATDSVPLAPAADILASIEAATAGLVTVADIRSAVAGWFDAPAGGGGFLDLAYGGNAAPPGPFPLGEGEALALPATASDPAVRDLLRGLATAALVARGALAGDPAARAQLLTGAGRTIADAGGRIVALRAEIGVAEERIAAATTRIASEDSALRIARSGLVEVDPYETASALTQVETQIETLYALTVRMSRLSLTDWLR
ncbi:MAG: flagellin [Pseudomonadota bacterium]|jgi:flagellar hook-associated protein 3 FlgL